VTDHRIGDEPRRDGRPPYRVERDVSDVDADVSQHDEAPLGSVPKRGCVVVVVRVVVVVVEVLIVKRGLLSGSLLSLVVSGSAQKESDEKHESQDDPDRCKRTFSCDGQEGT